jgi:hypothetical protein
MPSLKINNRPSNSLRFAAFTFFFLLLGVVFATRLPNTVKSESGNLNQTETHETATSKQASKQAMTF